MTTMVSKLVSLAVITWLVNLVFIGCSTFVFWGKFVNTVMVTESFIPSPFVNSWMIPCIWPTKYPQVILMEWDIACWKSITIKAMLVTSQLCCVCYVICMWLHQQGFFGEMESGKSAVSDQYKWYRDHNGYLEDLWYLL